MQGDCDVIGSCVSSGNYPGDHGNDEECVVMALQSVKLVANEQFDIETCCVTSEVKNKK